MIDLNYIRGFFPPAIAQNASFQKHMLKEYVELLALEWLSRSEYADHLAFIGGTNLRLIQGIDRFSEDLDFDCKNLSPTDFIAMTDSLIRYLQLQGLQALAKDRDVSHLTAFQRNIYFPELLFDLQLSGHREERFLMKIEAQDQHISYPREMATVNRLGFYFPVAVPPISVLLSMKLSALLSRQKGRDFYDVLFLWSRTQPDYTFLNARCTISSSDELFAALRQMVTLLDLRTKQRDFEHLLFDPLRSARILDFLPLLNQPIY